MDTMSPADYAAMNGSFGGNGMGGWWMIILFALIFGNGGFGFGGGDRKYATTDELSAGFNAAGVNNKLNDISAAIAGVNQNLGNAICQSEYKALEHQAALSAQIAQCCCETQQAIHAEGEATRSMIQQDKIEALQQQVNQLNLQAQLCGVVRYPTAATYGAGYSPFFGGCGCGCANI